ncbi:MAG: 3-phosphoglycerate dehydrogenase [Acidobacteriota bacterium]|jgi:D-3-phosphoglycerate dehydrogenase|nr:3-phosphoglycerate dehydrogenase [Acidobacteriota bacterium]
MKHKILVATEKPFSPDAIAGIRDICTEAGYELALLESYTDKADLEAAVKDVEALIVRSDKVTPAVIAAADQLKIVVRAGAGYDNIDLDAATSANVVVMNTPGQNANAVAELALGMMVYLARNGFNGKSGTELRGKTLGIHAFGNVGRDVARIARGFGMDVFAFDPFVTDDAIRAEGVTPLASVEELYSHCQYVSLHIPANDQTRESINYDLLSRMPSGAVLVNTARKEVICEESLVKVFRERSDFQYIADVAPDCKDQVAAEFPGRFFFTPKKMGAQTSEANVNAGLAAVRQIIAFFEKGDRTFQVNR